jgi:hypothetical protein
MDHLEWTNPIAQRLVLNERASKRGNHLSWAGSSRIAKPSTTCHLQSYHPPLQNQFPAISTIRCLLRSIYLYFSPLTLRITCLESYLPSPRWTHTLRCFAPCAQPVWTKTCLSALPQLRIPTRLQPNHHLSLFLRSTILCGQTPKFVFSPYHFSDLSHYHLRKLCYVHTT